MEGIYEVLPWSDFYHFVSVNFCSPTSLVSWKKNSYTYTFLLSPPPSYLDPRGVRPAFLLADGCVRVPPGPLPPPAVR